MSRCKQIYFSFMLLILKTNEYKWSFILGTHGIIAEHVNRKLCSVEFLPKNRIIFPSSILESFYDPDFGNCYTIPAKNSDGLPLEAREGDFWQESNGKYTFSKNVPFILQLKMFSIINAWIHISNGISDMSVLVDVEPDEYMEESREPGIFMVIHDENTLPDIHTDGLFLVPGLSYHIGIRKVRREIFLYFAVS